VAQASSEQRVEAVRRFNRFYTRRIGALDEGLLHSPFTLTQARVLFELAQRERTTAKEIAEALGLDGGYLSRILSLFGKRQLIARKRSREDLRRNELSLTAHGRRTFDGLDRRAHAATANMLSDLRTSDQQRLVASLDEVQRTLVGLVRDGRGDIELRTHRPGDIGWAIERHGRLYADEFKWSGEFEALVARLFADFATSHDPQLERMWIAEIDGERVGCVFVVRNAEDPSVAQLRCLLVDPKGRGKGVGRQLVQECIAFARAAGYRKMVLWTNDVLVAARRIYEAEGFQMTKSQRHHSFGQDLVGQTWELGLQKF
jgi:DNA-binding MarR family transcriptional regulator/GNAT superfamily N-acetyltransferase